MVRRLDEIVQDLEEMSPNRPYGITIKADEKTDNILVSNDDLGFAITRRSIMDGSHIQEFLAALAKLIEILSDPAETGRVKASSLIDVARIESKANL